jgi:hypothetical protein
MNAVRAHTTWSALLALLALACACTACSAPAPPASDAKGVAVEPAPAPSAAGAEATVVETPATAAPDTPAPQTAPPTAPLPEPAAAPAPGDASPPSPTARPPTFSKTPIRPMPPRSPPSADGKAQAPVHVTIDALSRGKGVPAETREAFKQIRALLEQQQATAAVAAMRYQRIGIEGESRLCVEFRNASDAQTALAEIRRIAAGADLLNVVEAPCPSKKE